MQPLQIGRAGECVARAYLGERGWRIHDANWHCRYGEIDLVASRGTVLAFIEVKTRTSTAHGHPLEAITARKLARLRRLSAAWLASHEHEPPEIRLDLIAILAPRSGPVRLEHVRGIG
ncbi:MULTISPECIES: YraN family protein [unclassified Pseudactinotalea]|uniref:YraN family protein n=1 Tax=unclassified Pseudactinotalea TaxID=2649176 RepID=UPI00128ADFBF|nr:MULTISPECIES: YraN family protein [unclassified Pseudactinotalea]MPV49602.1 YraN family protein [Pseudactinotalea sp. HY160]QGH69899.1 YraN family protein [Pseudactinotalea sp. HY158]